MAPDVPYRPTAPCTALALLSCGYCPCAAAMISTGSSHADHVSPEAMLAHFETLSTTAPLSQGPCNAGDQLELRARRRRVTPRAPRTYHPYMSNGDLHWIANYIWGIADDVLRDLYVPAITGTSSCR